MNAPALEHVPPTLGPVEARALRLVLAAALDRRVVQACLGVQPEALLWSSTLHTCAATLAARSGLVWCRLARQLDRRLAPWLADYAERSPLELLGTLSHSELARALSLEELAAAVWSLLRRREPGGAPLVLPLVLAAERLLVSAPPSRRRRG